MNKKMKLLSVLGLVTAILFLFSPMVTAQSLSISGKVIDKNSQEPVIGASVLIEVLGVRFLVEECFGYRMGLSMFWFSWIPCFSA